MRSKLDEIMDEAKKGPFGYEEVFKRIAERAFHEGADQMRGECLMVVRGIVLHREDRARVIHDISEISIHPAPAEEKPLNYSWVYKGGPLITNAPDKETEVFHRTDIYQHVGTGTCCDRRKGQRRREWEECSSVHGNGALGLIESADDLPRKMWREGKGMWHYDRRSGSDRRKS